MGRIKGSHLSEEHCRKIAEALKGNKNNYGKHLSNETKRKISEAQKGKFISVESRRKMSETRKGKHLTEDHCKHISKSLIDRSFSVEHRRKLSIVRKGIIFSEETRKKMSEAQKGNKSWRYIDGKCAERHGIRKSECHTLPYKLWREKVFQRDNYTCQICGDDTGGNLNADHIKPWSKYPELRYELDNGRTLCVPCHRKTDTWGRNTIYQF